MKRITLSLLVAVSALLSCCNTFVHKPAVTTEKKGNFQLEFLFEKDGCRVYRFYDTKWIYWSSCQGSTYEAHTEKRGKSSVQITDQVITVNQK